MAKQFMATIGGKGKVFFSKRSYLKWALSTRDGFKHLMFLPLLILLRLRMRKELAKMRESRMRESL